MNNLKNTIVVIIFVLIYSCSNNVKKSINVIPINTKGMFLYVLDDVKIFIPRENVFEYCDSICREDSLNICCSFSTYLSKRNYSQLVLNDSLTIKEFFLFQNNIVDRKDSLHKYSDFEYMYYKICFNVVRKCLFSGEVKLFCFETKEFVQTYNYLRENDENGGITDYYLLPNGKLFYKDEIAIGL